MIRHHITLKGIPSSKKNSKRWIQRGGRRFLIPSANHEIWHQEASFDLITQIRAVQDKLPMRVARISIWYYPKDKIRRDLTNVTESVMDLLTDCGVIADDNWFEVPDVGLYYGGQRSDPVTEVFIYEK